MYQKHQIDQIYQIPSIHQTNHQYLIIKIPPIFDNKNNKNKNVNNILHQYQMQQYQMHYQYMIIKIIIKIIIMTIQQKVCQLHQ